MDADVLNWKLGDENAGGGANIHAVVDGEGYVVAWTARVVRGGVEVVTEAQAKENARRIVTAVNAHDDLVAVCAKVLAALDASLRGHRPPVNDLVLANEVRAAIAKARGQ